MLVLDGLEEVAHECDEHVEHDDNQQEVVPASSPGGNWSSKLRFRTKVQRVIAHAKEDYGDGRPQCGEGSPGILKAKRDKEG